MSEHPIIPNSTIFWVGVINGVGEKIAPYFKGTPALPPLDWEKSQHYKWLCDMWRMWCFHWNFWIPHLKFRNRNGKLNVNLFASRFGWMFQRLVNVCLPPTREDYLWSLFVKVHKFLFGEIMLSSFFKRVTSYFSTKPGSVETKSTLVVEVSNVNLQSI